MHLQIAAKPSVLCCHLANTNKELAIPPFAKLLWSLLLLQKSKAPSQKVIRSISERTVGVLSAKELLATLSSISTVKRTVKAWSM